MEHLLSVELIVGDKVVSNYLKTFPTVEQATEEAERILNMQAELYLEVESGDFWEWEEYDEGGQLATISITEDVHSTFKVQPIA